MAEESPPIAMMPPAMVTAAASQSNTKAGTGTSETLECLLSDSSGEMVMIRFGAMTAACLAVALAATTPALARGGHGGWHGGGGGYHGGGAHFAGGGLRGGGFRHGGFGPGIAGAGIAAGIIAGSALGAGAYYGGYGPGYYDNSYAYDNGYDGGYDNGYAVRNGFVCQPGTFFRGEDGRRYLCQ
jgi:hypothetical protein